MIQQLRKKFIVVAMCSLCAVLAVIVGSLNAVSYYNIVKRADGILQMLAENEGRFPEDYPGRRDGPRAGSFLGNMGRWGDVGGMSPETPFETRFFSVYLRNDGEAVTVDTGRIAAIETAEAVSYAQEIYSGGRTKGFCGNYRFIQKPGFPEASRIIFMDCGKELNSFRSLAVTSIAASISGILAVFALVLFFSRKAFAPVEESYAKQRRFVTDASHELKTPLTIISANVDVLEMEGLENERTASIRNQVERLKGLTEQMVALSRMDEGGMERNFANFSLSEAVRETAGLFEPIALARGKRLETEIEEGIFYRGDEEKLCQMLSLLLDNAVKYASAREAIVLKLETCRRRGRRACLSLSNGLDEGSGLEAGGQDKLFERFYRPDSSRSSSTGGSGIGLSVAKSIVELHHGRITAECDGQSIRFTAWL